MKTWHRHGCRSKEEYEMRLTMPKQERHLLIYRELGLSDGDVMRLSDAWVRVFGHAINGQPHANHAMLQGIIQHGWNEWNEYKNKLSKPCREWIIANFPQIAEQAESLLAKQGE